MNTQLIGLILFIVGLIVYTLYSMYNLPEGFAFIACVGLGGGVALIVPPKRLDK